MSLFDNFIQSIQIQSRSLSAEELEKLRAAYNLATRCHEGQFRTSGEPYIEHPTRVATILAEMNLDIESLCAAFLHDCVEDTDLTLDEIQKSFGKEVAFLVDGVTKLGRLPSYTKEEQQAESFRKLLHAMTRDIRVVIIKLCDRLDNMRSLDALSPTKKERIAKETIQLYAPIAHRLGIDWIKQELEDLCFKTLKPNEYLATTQNLSIFLNFYNNFLPQVKKELSDCLLSKNIVHELILTPKHHWAVYQMTQQLGKKLEFLIDAINCQILVPTRSDCYLTLGYLHESWTPIPGRFKDYIAIPKTNGYQGLHTTIFFPAGQQTELQIRTHRMQQIAQDGIVSHWKYRSTRMIHEEEQTMKWLNKLSEWQASLADPTEFIETVKGDLSNNDVFVFTPQGDLKILPKGSIPLDFAYALHSEIGDHFQVARVNGIGVPMNYLLRSGDTVQIVTHSDVSPQREWVKMVTTSNARNKIRHKLRLTQRSKSQQLGLELIRKELGNYLLTQEISKQELLNRLDSISQKFKFTNHEDLLGAIGFGKITAGNVLDILFKDIPKKSSITTQTASHKNSQESSFSSHLIKTAKCCLPLPGDAIAGVLLKGRGVMVHRKICPTLLAQDIGRKVDINFELKNTVLSYPTSIKMKAVDRPGLLAEISRTFHKEGLNITQANCRSEADHAVNTFALLVKHVDQLQQVLFALKEIPGVISVDRETP